MGPRVYVDAARNPYGRMLMCHLFSPDLDALHGMAARIRVSRKWFQDPRTMSVSWPHYDICQSKRALALTAGAVEVDRYQLVAMGTIVRNVFFDASDDPLRLIPAKGREEVARWLAAEGWAPRALSGPRQ